MTSPKTLKRIDSLIWYLIYGGLFGVVLGMILDNVGELASVLLVAGGLALTFAGAVLLYVRSRLTEDS